MELNDTKFKGLEEAVLKLVHTFCAPPDQVTPVGGSIEPDKIVFMFEYENGHSGVVTCKTEMIGQCTAIKSITFE